MGTIKASSGQPVSGFHKIIQKQASPLWIEVLFHVDIPMGIWILNNGTR